MSCLFKWVHLSDIHFQAKSPQSPDFNSAELTKKLPPYLAEKIRPVDALIITGDFRFAPQGEMNPQNAADYIKQLMKSLEIDSSKLYLVPGNHDLNREPIRDDIIAGVRAEYTTTKGIFNLKRMQKLKDDFKFFDELRHLLNMPSIPSLDDNPHYVASLENCNLLMLNTALTAGMEKNGGIDDEHNLLIGTSYLSAAIDRKENDKPIIAVGHHGMSFLQDDESKTCSKFFDEHGIHLYLCGHAHKLWNGSFGNSGKEIATGCLMQDSKMTDAGFSVGQLLSDGTIDLECYKWDMGEQNWFPHPPQKKVYHNLYSISDDLQPADNQHIDTDATAEEEKMFDNHFLLDSYSLLGSRGIDGIRYIWKCEDRYVESIAFNKCLRVPADSTSKDAVTSSISAYTSSVSYGCHLSVNNQACRFCGTGKIPYLGNLCAEDMALQNIFMAKYDTDCPSFPHVRGNKREFAFMGQGEPGFSYPAVRRAIQLTDYAMCQIHQEVHRYIISTCGICDFVPILLNDIRNKVFKNKITLHFSFNAIDEDRTMIMPVNDEYDYKRFIKECTRFHAETGEKIGAGILMFNRYRFVDKAGKERHFTLTPKRLEKMLQLLDKDVFRIDLCDVNKTSNENQLALSNEEANKLFDIVKSKGFEGKIFSSFGEQEHSGCGMLSSSLENTNQPGQTTISHFNSALELLNEAIVALDG